MNSGSQLYLSDIVTSDFSSSKLTSVEESVCKLSVSVLSAAGAL